jgi:sugar O-acyltransferase (sialic acid O-acetyltransferase NeuD family)
VSTESTSTARPVVIIGAGENADIAYEYFTHDSPRDVAGFAVEREFLSAPEHQGLPLIAIDDLPKRFPHTDYDTYVAISSTQLNRLRERLYLQVKAMGYTCASYVSSRAFVWHNVTIGENTFVFENNVLQHHVEVGDNVVLWSGNHVGHRTRIADHVFLSSHVVVSGYCSIGAYTFMGVNSCVGDGITIAEDCVVGAGAVVVKDLPARGVYVGSPAKPTGRDSFDSFGVKQ